MVVPFQQKQWTDWIAQTMVGSEMAVEMTWVVATSLEPVAWPASVVEIRVSFPPMGPFWEIQQENSWHLPVSSMLMTMAPPMLLLLLWTLLHCQTLFQARLVLLLLLLLCCTGVN